MSYYKKFISYIDLYEHGEKIKNIGFTKSEIRDDIWKLNIIIKGLPITDTLMCELKALDVEHHLERFQITNGSGNYTLIYNIKDLLNKEVSFSDIKGLRFQLSANRYGLCRWEESKELENVNSGQEVSIQEPDNLKMKAAEAEEKIQEYKEETEEKIQEYKEETEEKIQEYKEEIEAEERLQKYKKDAATEEKVDAVKNVQENTEAVGLPDYTLENISSDKWQQLCRMYPEVHPFEEAGIGEFISVQPKDFVILSHKYQNLVNNSFLLHGYFNYRHILLGKKRVEKQIRYYIGVPGIFHDREKMVAVMFGFEAFEAVEKEIQGAFGYYMKEVEI